VVAVAAEVHPRRIIVEASKAEGTKAVKLKPSLPEKIPLNRNFVFTLLAVDSIQIGSP
jgi:hypothetical protein